MRAATLSIFATAAALVATPAIAQEAMTPAPDQEAPMAGDTTTTQATVSDAEVDQFATAVVAVDAINKDASIAADAKQTQMASAVTASGLTPERFNSIATQMGSDTALQAKVGAAIQAKAPAPATTPAPAQ
ncbi:DUF4168 domain-containing protein [Sphingomonas aestuarii]